MRFISTTIMLISFNVVVVAAHRTGTITGAQRVLSIQYICSHQPQPESRHLRITVRCLQTHSEADDDRKPRCRFQHHLSSVKSRDSKSLIPRDILDTVVCNVLFLV